MDSWQLAQSFVPYAGRVVVDNGSSLRRAALAKGQELIISIQPTFLVSFKYSIISLYSSSSNFTLCHNTMNAIHA